MIKTLLKRKPATETVSQPVSQPVEPEPEAAKPTATRLAMGSTVAGYTMGEEVAARVSAKAMPNPRMVYISVPDWDGLAVAHVNDQKDWRPGETIHAKFVGMRPDYVLEFAGPGGKRHNRWGRR